MIITKLFRLLITALTLASLSCLSVNAFAAKENKKPITSVNKISINAASANVLSEVLNGVGLKKAQAIVAYRDAHGKFARLEDLTLVKGIGAATLEKNKAKLTL